MIDEQSVRLAREVLGVSELLFSHLLCADGYIKGETDETLRCTNTYWRLSYHF